MMTKKHSRKITGIKALFALPLLIFLTILFASNTNTAFNSNNIYAEIQKGKISGYVYDVATKQPLEGASIILIEDVSIVTSTDAKGYFELKNPIDNAHIVVSYVGYKTEKVKVENNEAKILMSRAKYSVIFKETEVKSEEMYDVPDAPPPPPPKEGEQGENVIVEDMAMPQGGFEGLSDYINKQTIKYKEELAGKLVKLSFVVDEKGKVINVKMDQSSGNEKADKIAYKIVYSIPDWKPAFQKSKNVPVDYTIDIKF